MTNVAFCRASAGRRVGLATGGAVQGADPATERSVHTATEHLGMSGQRTNQHGRERGAHEKMIPVHSRLLQEAAVISATFLRSTTRGSE
jgi:hypothetical protein